MKNRRNIIESELPPQNPLDIWMKDGKFYRSTKKGWTLIEDQMEFTDSKLMYKSTATSGTIGVNKETGKASIYNDVTKEWSPLGGGLTETTWQELKNKRDAGKLTPGSLYRITDYNCTTTQENTRSAGHQFDIVLLALSENKLAEEGWAMEHPTDVYNVTFADGVTKKCYIFDKGYTEGVHICNLVDAITLNGLVNIDIELLLIDEANKTATSGDIVSTSINDLDSGAIENCPYNYFQNSNLSAWKVWYCLDNDKSRFAWADDSVDEDTPPQAVAAGIALIRMSDVDVLYNDEIYWGWSTDGTAHQGTLFYTISNPSAGSALYQYNGIQMTDIGENLDSYTPAHEGTGLPNGRGVIYRLIDEWNNDVAYDFKNIQFVRKLTDGEYNENGADTWVYTFNLWYNNACEDASVKIGNKQCATYNIITSLLSGDNDIFVLSNSVCLGFVNNRGKYCTSKNVRIHNSEGCTLGFAVDVFIDISASIYIKSGGIYCIMCSDSSYDVEGIYILNKKVLTEE